MDEALPGRIEIRESSQARDDKLFVPNYADLLREIESALALGQRQIERARIVAFWNVGRLIHQHVLNPNGRARTGDVVIKRLSQDTKLNVGTLYNCIRFYRQYPTIPVSRGVSWSHYIRLVYVHDPKLRAQLERETRRFNWTEQDLVARIRALDPSGRLAGNGISEANGSADRLAPKRGQLDCYHISKFGGVPMLDLGFTSCLELTVRDAKRFRQTYSVRLKSDGTLISHQVKPSELYTYRAKVIRVIDGDTIWMSIQLAPRYSVREKLRLRGLDCPELTTTAGRAARVATEMLLKHAAAIRITTTKPDKWDRYLSDVFITLPSGEEIFLNNYLLENGHAIRKDRYTLGDWETLLTTLDRRI